MDHPAISRRQMLAGSSLATAAAILSERAAAGTAAASDDFAYEIRRSEAEWRETLNDEEFQLLRRGGTEVPKSSTLWNEERPGNYYCKGCGLHLYESDYKIPLDKGWAFFIHSVPRSLLMDVHWPPGVEPNPDIALLSAIEVHCRRCGSHHGHLVFLEGYVLHCINGKGLHFEPTAA